VSGSVTTNCVCVCVCVGVCVCVCTSVFTLIIEALLCVVKVILPDTVCIGKPSASAE